MEADNIIESLNERIKELSCLYEISNIITIHHNSFDKTMNAIVQAIPKAWRHSESAIAEISLSKGHFISGTLQGSTICQSVNIEVNEEENGKLIIHYPGEKFSKSDFLQEEHQLLKKLAKEIGTYIENFEHRQNEELMERKFRHNDRLAILGQISAGIAHELNTPLTSILGFTQLIQKSDKNISDDIEKIINSTLHAREIVKNLMFFACEIPQQMKEISINSLVEDSLKLLKPSFQNAEITLNLQLSSEDIVVKLDPIQITQVIFNLVINAIQATPPAGNIIVKLRKEGNQLKMYFIDNGKGMSSQIKDRIFEPFFTTKPEGEGSGLGLSVVHGIIKKHNGTINFSSEEEGGTTFIVSFPLQQKQ
jgi:signal transduction histidine kinase